MSARETLEALIADAGLTLDVVFVPFSKSRNAAEKHKSLNWRVTLKRNGRDVLTTDYSAGIAHCPAYKLSVREVGFQNSIARHELIDRECETGKVSRPTASFGPVGAEPILPDTVDVIACLVMEADVLDAASFEDWASDYGYDADSRKAEGIYRACLAHALALRAALGDAKLATLREAAHEL